MQEEGRQWQQMGDSELRQYARDNLLDNGYIFVDSSDVDSIFLTQKAIDEYSVY